MSNNFHLSFSSFSSGRADVSATGMLVDCRGAAEIRSLVIFYIMPSSQRIVTVRLSCCTNSKVPWPYSETYAVAADHLGKCVWNFSENIDLVAGFGSSPAQANLLVEIALVRGLRLGHLSGRAITQILDTLLESFKRLLRFRGVLMPHGFANGHSIRRAR